MKFFTELIALCAATIAVTNALPVEKTAFATPTSGNNYPETPIYGKFNTTEADFEKKCFGGEELNAKIATACISIRKESEIESYCKNDCISLLKTFTEKVNACQDVPETLKKYHLNSAQWMAKGHDLLCQKDEKDKSCALVFLEEDKEKKVSLMDIAKQNCASQKCSAATADYFNVATKLKKVEVEIDNLDEDKKELESFLEVGKYLESVKCTGTIPASTTQAETKGQATSDAKSLKVGTTLLVAVGLLFTIF